ncbi:MAG: C40 family peptidase [Peptococcaceae bacterium]|nr:C40 family peptidase [Peptococcaceae bacterium]
MKRFCYVLIVALLALLFITFGNDSAEAAPIQMEIKKDAAYLRYEPSIDAEIGITLYYLTKVDHIVDINTSWSVVSYDNAIYYTHSSNLRDIEPRPSIETDNPFEQFLYDFGLSFLGTPYLLGAEPMNPESFDCSSFVLFLYKVCAGIDLPRKASLQSESDQGVLVTFDGSQDMDNLRIGDCIYFGNMMKDVKHVAMYIGNGEILHASSSGGMIRISPLDENRLDSIVLIKRYL